MTVASDLFYSSYASFYQLKNGWRPEKFIFILSHMRSGSTLLAHLLASNPAICGYGETRTRYYNRRQFGVLTGKVLYTLRGGPLSGHEKYVLCKVLHDRFLKPEHAPVLPGDKSKVVFLLREPKGTLNSLRQTLGQSETSALDYYLKRLATLEELARRLTSQASCAVLTHDQLLNRTDGVFRILERFLDLDHPLTETYQILPTTGRKRIGDPSTKILTGKILRDEPEPARVTISDETIKLADVRYRNCLSQLQNTCLTVDTSTGLNNAAQPNEI